MTALVWGGFLALFLALLWLDLAVLHRESAELSVRQALFWTMVWVGVVVLVHARGLRPVRIPLVRISSRAPACRRARTPSSST